MSKQTAIDLVNAFAADNGPSVFPKIDRAALAAGLIDRINDPNTINQRGTPFCGPANLTRAVALANPDVYAQAAIDLYTKGVARFNGLEVRAGRELKQSPPLGNANAADWIMLASIRDSDNWFLSPAGWFGLSLAGITLPGTMESWFRSAGYQTIISKTYLALKPVPMVLAVEAHEASQYAKPGSGYKVVLFIDSNLLDADSQDNLFSVYPDHWVALTTPIADNGDIIGYDAPISFKVFSWGREMPVPVDPSHPLTKRSFLTRYYGYIAAK